MPFRERPDEHLGPLAADAAVHDAVGQMVRQFADELAFLRELVQNSLDADATAIDVLLDHHRVDNRATLEVTVRDDGFGMDQATMERCLLVLFRSSKEGDASRIGKFGVGFFSVFAARPDRVTVESGREVNEPALRLRLSPDFTWELEAAPPRRGTSVRVRIPLRELDALALADRCIERLRHWCPHVRAPVTVRCEGIPERAEPLRVDRPHDLDAELCVRDQRGDAVTLVGLSLTPARRYLNRGLLLQAEEGAPEPEQRGLAWLVDAPDLHHTISRDAVVRDAAFAARLRKVRELVDGPLREKLRRTWNDLAARCALARSQGPADRDAGAALARLARCLAHDPLALRAREVHWPLLEPLAGGDARTRDLSPGLLRGTRFYTAASRSALTRALAAKGAVILDAAPCGAPDDDAAVNSLLPALCPDARPCERLWVLLRRVEPRTLTNGRALLDALRHLASATSLGSVILCEAVGSGADRLWYSVPDGHDAARGEGLASLAEDQPFTFRRRTALLLRAAHPDVALALDAAGRDARFAALALLRLVLLRAGELDAETDLALVQATLSGASS